VREPECLNDLEVSWLLLGLLPNFGLPRLAIKRVVDGL
jgi:hypothetical protein